MPNERPDLSQVSAEILAYIETLEAEIARLHRHRQSARMSDGGDEAAAELVEPVEYAEPPTTMQIITATAAGAAKRTARHLYLRQRRGGMGVFDLDTSPAEPPAVLATADEAQNLLLITNLGRAFRMPVQAIAEEPVHARGTSILSRFNLDPTEQLAAILPDHAQGYVALAGRSGMVRLLRHHVFGEYMKPGTPLIDIRVFGPLAGACWTPGDGDLFIATAQGKGIRFAEKLVPPMGGQGIRLSDGDEVVAICGVYSESGVFLLGEDGRGTTRQMEGFAANKAPGAGGKIAMLTNRLVAAATVQEDGDLFIISRLGKIIRFSPAEVPAKEGVVQGVNCMALRADECKALVYSPARSAL